MGVKVGGERAGDRDRDRDRVRCSLVRTWWQLRGKRWRSWWL